jgi:TrmH family RNA methyltransferase
MTRILTENAEFQLLEALRHNRRKREQRGEFLIEGVQAITRALAVEWPVRAALVPAAAQRSPWAEDCLTRVDTVIEVRADLFARLTARDEPPELMLLGRIPVPDLAAVPHQSDGVVVVLDRPGNPGNLGTIIRTSDALGASGVLLSGHGAHLYDPQTVRASVGSLFALPVVPVPSNEALIDWVAQWRTKAPVTVYATDEHGEVPLSGSVVLSRPAVILLGSERTGLSTALAALADVSLAIPMAGSASSLNVAVAAGIVLHHVMSSLGSHGC